MDAVAVGVFPDVVADLQIIINEARIQVQIRHTRSHRDTRDNAVDNIGIQSIVRAFVGVRLHVSRRGRECNFVIARSYAGKGVNARCIGVNRIRDRCTRAGRAGQDDSDVFDARLACVLDAVAVEVMPDKVAELRI